MNVRDRVKQTAVYVSASEFDLTSGTAAEDHVTFETAYNLGGIDTAVEQFFRKVPVTIERSNGEWCTMLADISYLNTPNYRLKNAVLFQSSTGIALTFTASEEVTITLGAGAAMFSGMAVRPMSSFVNEVAQDTGQRPWLGASMAGLLAIGTEARADALDAVALGSDVRAGYSCSYVYGRGIDDFQPAEQTHGFGPVGFATSTLNHTLQASRVLMNLLTTDATQTALGAYIDSATVSSGGETISCWAGLTTVKGRLHAISSTDDMKVWNIEFTAKTTLDYVTTSLFGSLTKTVENADAGAATWDVTVTFDSVSNTFSIEVTGEAAKTIVWAFDGIVTRNNVEV